MKTWSTVLAVMMALVLSVGIADAAAKAKPVRGKITKVDGANVTITAKDGTETTVATTDSTTVTINGDKKTVADLAGETGKNARVTLDADGKTATAIAVGKMTAASAPASQPAQ